MTSALVHLRALVEQPYAPPVLRGLEGLGSWELLGRRLCATLAVERGRFTVTCARRVVGQATYERHNCVRLSPRLFAFAMEIGGVDAARELHAELERRGRVVAARVVDRAELWHRELPCERGTWRRNTWGPEVLA